jgi:hypothetical protein
LQSWAYAIATAAGTDCTKPPSAPAPETTNIAHALIGASER